MYRRIINTLSTGHFIRDLNKHFHIHGSLSLITKHGLYLGTMIISLIVPTESTIENIIVNVHRFLLTLRHGHINNYDNIFIVTDFIGLHIIFRQKIDTFVSTHSNKSGSNKAKLYPSLCITLLYSMPAYSAASS